MTYMTGKSGVVKRCSINSILQAVSAEGKS